MPALNQIVENNSMTGCLNLYIALLFKNPLFNVTLLIQISKARSQVHMKRFPQRALAILLHYQ